MELLLIRPNMGGLLIRDDGRSNEYNYLKYIHRYLLPISLKLGSEGWGGGGGKVKDKGKVGKGGEY